MRAISELSGKELQWVQPGLLKMYYELRAGDERVATLRFRSTYGTFATAESADGCWTFKRVGFWQTRVSIRPCGASHETAVFKNDTWSGGGTVEFPDGRRVLANTNFWQTNYEFMTEAGEALVEFRAGGWIRLSAQVEVDPKAATLAELPLLVTLGWYLVVMMDIDTGASAVIIG
jgi:hypothetical protein